MSLADNGRPDAGRYVAGEDHTDKRAAQVAHLIETDIIRRGWPVGESLGSEQALQETFRVSRSVVREAVRLVEHHQVARVRRGPGGGLVVTAPDAAPATRATVIYLEYLGITIDELLDARMLLEPLAAELAAERIDEAGIEQLRAILRRPLLPTGDSDLHVALGELTGNPVLALFVDVLARLTVRYAGRIDPAPGDAPGRADGERTAREPAPAGRAAQQRAVEKLAYDHTQIVEAVTGGDAARAKSQTEQHVRTVTGWLDRSMAGASRGRSRPTAEATARKRAEVVAADIHEDIAAQGWPVGAVFGTESELLDRYGVSRSVLREAVRLLEYHTVARMRRGPGGGLVITEPTPEAIVDTIALYLEYRHPTREDLSLVRDVIEVGNVTTVVGRRGDSDVAAFIAGQVRDSPLQHDDFRQAGLAEYTFHADLAELAGNRVLNLFLRILVELFRRHWLSTMKEMPGAADAEDVVHAHGRIVEAIASGDASLARHRSRRHLEALSSWWM
ncbi:MAG TPA: FCD domain-containing protein [Mycobacterium sp.]|nr:FCD domain-containing protein [Mycobacterium sp.]